MNTQRLCTLAALCVLSLSLAACGTSKTDRALSGGGIGAGVGAAAGAATGALTDKDDINLDD